MLQRKSPGSSSLRQCTRGAALIEFALVLPVLTLLLVATVELSRFALIEMKLDKAANAMTDYVTQGSTVRTTDLTGFAGTMGQIMKPFAFSGSVIYSSMVTNRNNLDTPNCMQNVVNCITWQNRPTGTDNSALGGVGSAAALPGGYSLAIGQNLVAAEVYYNYAPLLPITAGLITSLAPRKLYKISVSKPRLAPLTTLQ